MSKIKSALELALERTADIKTDKDALLKEELVKNGKITAGKYLSDPKSVSLSEKINEYKGAEKEIIKDALLETLLANIVLPRYENDINKVKIISDALLQISEKGKSEKKNLEYLMNQFADLFKQYLENFSHLEEELKKQWEPRLRQKEQQLRQQTGQEINMTPEQDPEFVQILNEQLKRLEDQYAGVIKQGKDQIKQLV